MAYEIIFRGTMPDDDTGDDLREGARKINSNFEELYNERDNLVKDTFVSIDFNNVGPYGITTDIALAVNALPSFEVDHATHQYFYALRFLPATDNDGLQTPNFTVQRFVWKLKLGKGEYGAAGTVLTGADLQFKGAVNSAGYNTITYNLGEIGVTDIQDAVNSTGPYLTPTGANIKFKVERNGEVGYYLYVGDSDTSIGDGFDPTVNNDYIDLSTVTPSIPGEGDSVFDKAPNGGIFIKDRDEANYGDIGENALDFSHSDDNGIDNGATGKNSIAHGKNNKASGAYSMIGGGQDNEANTGGATILSGGSNVASGVGSMIVTGSTNKASALMSAIVSGEENKASGPSSFIGNGLENKTLGRYAAIVGGEANTSEGEKSFIGGGEANSAIGHVSAILGGASNEAKGDYSSILGGIGNIAQSWGEVVAGAYGTIYTAVSTIAWNALDRAFSVGIGKFDNRKDGLIILKSGLATVPEQTEQMITDNPKAIVTSEYLTGFAGSDDYAEETKPRVLEISSFELAAPDKQGVLDWINTNGIVIDKNEFLIIKISEPSISTWDTTQAGVSANNQIALPLDSTGTYDFEVYDSDGNFLKHITDYTDNIVTLPVEGIQQITIVGQFERFYLNDEGDKEKLLSIQQFGSEFKVVSGTGMFRGAENLTEIGGDIDVSQVTDMSRMFQDATSFNSDISAWDVSQVTDMRFMFYRAYVFNSDISAWDVSQVTNMRYMFWDATSFNSDISAWDVSQVTSMLQMFQVATSFNSDISAWDVSQVTDMRYMFFGASSFNQDISPWNVGNVTSMGSMFRSATSFNQDISAWNVGNVTNMAYMFWQASAFNQDILDWDVSSVTNMDRMFYSASSFNQDISAWDFSSVTNLDSFMRNKTYNDYDAQYYTNLLKRWSTNAQDNLSTDMGTIRYTAEGQQYKDILTGTKGWSIVDGGQV